MKQSSSKNGKQQHTVEMLSRYPFGASQPNISGRILVKLTRRFASSQSEELKRKIEFHSKLKHPSLICIIKAFQSRQAKFFDIFFEYIPKSISSTASKLNKQHLLQYKNNLKDLCIYLIGMNVYPEIAEELIGFDSNGRVKLFLDVDFRVIKPTQNKGELIKIKFAEVGEIIAQYERMLQHNPKQGQAKSQVCISNLITSRSPEPFLRYHYVSPSRAEQTDNNIVPTFSPRGQTESRIYFAERQSHPLRRTNSQIDIPLPQQRHLILQSVSPPTRSISLADSFNSPIRNQQHAHHVLHKRHESHGLLSTMSRLTLQNPSNSRVYRVSEQRRQLANYCALQLANIQPVKLFSSTAEPIAINQSNSNNNYRRNEQQTTTKAAQEKDQVPFHLRVPILQKLFEEIESEGASYVQVKSCEKVNSPVILQPIHDLKMKAKSKLAKREQITNTVQQLPKTTVTPQYPNPPVLKIAPAYAHSESSKAEPACIPQSPRESRRNQSMKDNSGNSQNQISGAQASPISSRREGQQETTNMAHSPIVINVVAQKDKFENNAASKLMDLARQITEHSLDTYYAQLGEILQMPRINITQLRQTTQSPTVSAPRQKEKLHESVGMHATKPILDRRGGIVQEEYGQQSPRESHLYQNPFRRKQHKLDRVSGKVDYTNPNHTRENQNYENKIRSRLYHMAQNFRQGEETNRQAQQQLSQKGMVLMQYRIKNTFTMQPSDDPLTQQFNNLFESQNQTREYHQSSHIVAEYVHTKQEPTEEDIYQDNQQPESGSESDYEPEYEPESQHEYQPEYQPEYEPEYEPGYEPQQEQLEPDEEIEIYEQMAQHAHDESGYYRQSKEHQNNEQNVQIQHRSHSSSRPTEQRSRLMKESNSTSQADFVPETNSRALRSDQINQRVMMALKRSEAMLDYFNKFKMQRMEEQGNM